MATLSRLFIHPVKSMRGIGITHALADISGLAFDRIFMVTEPDGTFITARQFPQMVRFTPSPLHDGLHLTAPDGSSALVRFTDFTPQDAPTEVWGNHFTARVAPTAINQWLSGFFSRDVQLRWVGPQLTRRVKRHNAVPLGFADGYPYLLTNEASLRDLQQRCPAGVQMEQFRPNLVVSGVAAWEEDSWKVLRIGDVIFDVVKPCSRCIFTTVSPEKGQKHPSGEPLATLQAFRTAQDNGDVDFGQNLIARNSGVVRVGDEVEILATAPAKAYGATTVDDSVTPDKHPDASVTIDWQGQTFCGNNQQVLLEQLENQGIRIPYSCRAGICGCCRIRLLEGEVSPLKKSAIGDDGTILSCSCVPKTALRLEN
ncbi:TPA: YcbX family protein [Salmonella enterica subsp. enterica serovar Infantis]|uniref:MOSC domain-containing protein n=1 Tax=Salmonella infantis TaxID=595 RepID=A0A5U8PMN0_SALIN|nr:YcbX family protein [Salmonella enterica]EBH8067766.1 MOSC domain-containing protein [Salmonella bongori]EBS2230285.1 MOSC domain-containing protein [Salmonella enterica subsp. enterica serovar Middlesbrough]EDU5885915.1 MOSC domain-containing protein [Salmonella enterica subsp. enterica serovar Hillingdon]HCL0936552.1 YcbX family protein [Salmonella enterica subsp. enterica serovar Pomona]EAB5818472.1 MOSC domain-containing protein [Salmonella enterica subsp. enterica serovar Infantis]